MIWCINIFLFNFTKYTMYFGMDIPIALLRPELILIVQILLMNVLFVPLYTYIFTPFGVQEYVRTPEPNPFLKLFYIKCKYMCLGTAICIP